MEEGDDAKSVGISESFESGSAIGGGEFRGHGKPHGNGSVWRFGVEQAIQFRTKCKSNMLVGKWPDLGSFHQLLDGQVHGR